MAYIRILEADTKSELEFRTNQLLTEAYGKVRGFSIHPTTGVYSCVVEFMGGNVYYNQKGLDHQEINHLERTIMLDLLRDNKFSSKEFHQQYELSDCEAVRKHNLYENVRGTQVGKRVSLEDIKISGYKKAAEIQQLDLRSFKEVHDFSWKDLADLFNLQKCPLDYGLLATNLGLNLEDISLIDRRVRYVLKSKSSTSKK